MKTETKSCLNCHKSFEAPLKEIKRGFGKFCSFRCSATFRKNKPLHKEHNCICEMCGTSFYRNRSRLLSSKSGLTFCSRKCKDEAQKLKHNNFSIQPAHYGQGNGIHSYRKWALDELPLKCNRCGYDTFTEILQVHHKDKNRTNSSLSNLEVLCPNCHAIEHRTIEK